MGRWAVVWGGLLTVVSACICGCSDGGSTTKSTGAGQGVAGADGGGASGTGSASNAGSGAASGGASSGNGGRGMIGSGAPMVEARCGSALAQPRCLASGWCWETPVPFGGSLNAIDGVPDARSVFAVGAQGAAFRLCGDHWAAVDTGVEVELFDVWHPRADLAIAVGEAGTVLRWDGSAWSKLAAPTDRTLRAVWGTSEGHVWLGGDPDADGAVLFSLAGTTFERVALPAQSGAVRAIDGRSGSDVFVVTSDAGNATTLHFDGKAWTPATVAIAGTMQDLRAYPDGTTLALVQADAGGSVYEWTNGAWQQSYASEYFRLSALFSDLDGRPAVIAESRDFALPGRAFGFDGAKWSPGRERTRALPRRIWNGDQRAFGAGAATMLLERSDNPVWAQSADVPTPFGSPAFFGSKSDDSGLVLVTEHQLLQRKAGSWTLIAQVDEPIVVATIEEMGTFVVAERDQAGSREPGAVRFYGALGWRGPVTPIAHHPLELLANANLSVWSRDASTVYNYGGSTWADISKYCPQLAHHPTRMRQGAARSVWVITDDGLAELDIMKLTCSIHAFSGELADVAWTQSGALWGISRSGELGQWQGATWTPRKTVLPAGSLDHVQELLAGAGEKLWVTLTRDDPGSGNASSAIELDVSGDVTVSEPIAAPGAGRIFASGDVLYEAVPGGVLRRAAP